MVLGNIFSSVYPGEIQGESLGIDIDVFNEKGKKLTKNKKGELVVKTFSDNANKTGTTLAIRSIGLHIFLNIKIFGTMEIL